jgi:RHS repeat-associated protein
LATTNKSAWHSARYAAHFLGKTLSLQRKAKEDPATPYQGDLGQMNLLGMQSLPPASTAKLVLEVYNGNSLLSTQEQHVSSAGETAWEELAIGMTLPANTTSIVAYMKHEGGTDAYFDDLKIEITDKPVAMVVQENQYYPFGLGMKGLDYVQNVNQENKFTFNGKEKQTELGLHQYDFHARNYDYHILRTTTLDPHGENYYSLSPYSFLGNNPVKNIDPDGKDYGIYFEKNKNGDWQIRITATYYVQTGDKKSRKSADDAVAHWNNQKDFSLQVKSDGKKSQIGVVFDLKVVEVDNPEAEKTKDLSATADAKTKDGSSNIYKVVDKKEITKPYARGLTTSLNNIKVPENDSGVTVGAHEIGHTLGLEDGSSGIMAGGEDITIHNWAVDEIIEFNQKTQVKYPNNRKVTIHGQQMPKGKVKTTQPYLPQYENK